MAVAAAAAVVAPARRGSMKSESALFMSRSGHQLHGRIDRPDALDNAAWAVFASAVLRMLLNFIFIQRLLDLRWSGIFSALWRTVSASLAMTLVLWVTSDMWTVPPTTARVGGDCWAARGQTCAARTSVANRCIHLEGVICISAFVPWNEPTSCNLQPHLKQPPRVAVTDGFRHRPAECRLAELP